MFQSIFVVFFSTNFSVMYMNKSMFNSTINQESIMFKYSLIITFVLIVKSQRIPRHYWCPKNLLLCLLNGIDMCDRHLITDDEINRVKCRIEIARENYCRRKPWDLFNKKINLAREYTTCMIECADYLKNLHIYGEYLKLCDAECRKIFGKIPALLPIIDPPQNCSVWSG